MKIIKRILLFIFVLLVLFLAAAVAIPYFFKDKIVAVVKEEVNDRINATFDFSDVDISLLRSFPNLSVGLKDFSVIGKDEFEDVTLASGQSLNLVMDLMSVINSGSRPVEIKKVHLQDPVVNVFVLKNGKANYDIALPSGETEETTSSGESSAMEIALTEYSIENANLIYDDRTLPMRLEAKGMNHSGSGNFATEVFDLATETEIDALTVRYDNVGYLVKSNAKLDLTVNADMNSMKFTLKENSLTVNALQLIADGFVELPNATDIVMDLNFAAPKNTFKNLLSVIPNAYVKDFEDVKANGNFTLAGNMKGTFNNTSYPSFNIKSTIQNGDVQYPDLPVGISNVNANIELKSPTANLNDMQVNIPTFALKVGNNPLEGYFKLKTPLTDPDMDMRLDGVLDLAELNKAYPIEGMEEMTGKITSDVVMKTKLSTIEREDYANVDMSGAVKVENLVYDAADMPAVKIKNVEADFTPQRVLIPEFDVQTGAKSDLHGSAEFDNILAYFSPEKTLKGRLNLRSNYFNANEWMTETEAAPTTESTTAATPEEAEAEVFDRYDFSFAADMKKIDYDAYDINKLKGSGNLTPNKFTINNFSTNIGKSDIAVKGVVNNMMNYLYENETLTGNISIKSDYFNLNPFMEEDPAAAAAIEAKGAEVNQEDLEPVLIPENVDITIAADMGKVIYTDLELTDLSGNLVVGKQAVTLENVKGNTLGGQIALTGGYGTEDPEKPSFDLKTDLQGMSFQKAFDKFNTFEKIAPIGKFINGKFNTSLALNGILGKDMSPDLNSLNLNGFLQTLNGVIAGFEPLNKVGEQLNIDALKTIEIKNSKNWLEVKNGKFEVKEFDHTYQDVDMKIGGWHMISNEGMEYRILAKVPREKLGQLNDVAGKGLDWLNSQASQLGLNVNVGEFVNVALTITGSASSPKIGVKLLGTEGEGQSIQDAAKDKAQEEINKQKEILENKAKEEAEKAKDRAKAEADKLKKEAEDRAKAEAEKLKKKAEEEAKKLLEEEARKKAEEAAKKAEEKLGDKAKDELDKLKDKLPWGKKKKGGN